MKRKIVLPAIHLLAGMLCCSVNAQDNDSMKVNALKEVVISATRTEKNPIDVGRSITVIGQDEISSSVFNSVSELLSAHEGIYIVGSGQNPGMNQSIFLRGSNSNQTVIMIDGIRINDVSSVNNTIDLTELPLAIIDRIEIIRGSHSTLFGSSAIGGVINIITKKNNTSGVHANAELKVGEFGSGTSETGGNAAISYGFKNGFYINGFADNMHSNGLDATTDTVSDAVIFKHRDKDNWNKFSEGGRAGYRNDKLNLSFSLSEVKMKTDIDKGAYQDDDNYKLDFNRKLYSFSGNYQLSEKISVMMNAGIAKMTRDAKNDSSITNLSGDYDHTFTHSYYSGKYSSLDAQCNIKLKSIENVLGLAYSKEEMNQSNYIYSDNFGYLYEVNNNLDSVNPHAATTAAFFQTDINGSLFSNKLNQLNLLMGLRFNHHDFFGNNVTYELNPSVKINANSLLYASWSTGFNAPSLYQLFSPDKYYAGNLSLGNKNLKPEKSSSLEFGIKQHLNNQFSFNIAVFSSVTENIIEYVYLWDKNIGIDTLGNDWLRDDYRGDKYINAGKLSTHGMEISLQAKISEKLNVETNVSFVAGKIEYNASGIDTVETGGNHIQLYSNGSFLNKEITTSGLTRRPVTANISLYYLPSSKWLLGLSLRYTGARDDIYYDLNVKPYGALATTKVEDYTLMDGNIRFSFSKRFSLALRIENIADARYNEIKGFTTRGRGFYFAARIII